MIVCVPVTDHGTVDPRWGRADVVAVAKVEAGEVVAWDEHQVSWGTLHDEGPEGSHHARVARFLREHGVETVVADHMGPGMQNMLTKMGIRVHIGVPPVGDARTAVTAAVSH